jgi:hypothetical protein
MIHRFPRSALISCGYPHSPAHVPAPRGPIWSHASGERPIRRAEPGTSSELRPIAPRHRPATQHRSMATDRWRIYLTLPVEPSWLALAWAGILIGGVGARLGPNASSYLYKLVEPEPMPVDVLVPVARYAQRHGPWHFHRERAGARSASTHGSLPRLDVEATVLDLCARSTEGEIVGLISTAVQRRLTVPREVVCFREGFSMSSRCRGWRRRVQYGRSG